MALIVNYLSPEFDIWLSYGFVKQVTQLLICITSGVVSYVICLILLGVRLSDIKVAQKNS